MTKVAKMICPMCSIGCGLDVFVEDGRVVKAEGMPEHPINQICPKGASLHKLVHHSDRILKPMRKVNGSFKEIGWREAMDVMRDNLATLRATSGPDGLMVVIGDAVGLRETRHIPAWFCKLYGTANMSSTGSFCHYANKLAMNYTIGNYLWGNFRGAKCVVAWGKNYPASVPITAASIKRIVKGGGNLIVVDPRKTELAKIATFHLQLLPGTDAALALAMLNVIIGEKLFEHDFVEKYTTGFPALAAHVVQFTPEWASEITRVPADQIRQAARLYGNSRPAAIGFAATPEHNVNGIQLVRALCSLVAITGNLDVAGGSTYLDHAHLQHPKFPQEIDLSKRIGRAEYPLFSETKDEAQIALFNQVMEQESPAIKTVICQATNPMGTQPNTNRLRKALARVDTLIVMDVFWSETAKMADLVLPAATIAERVELCDHGYAGSVPLMCLSNRAIDPVGEAWPDWKLWFELAKELGHGEQMPWNDIEECIDFQLAPLGLSVQQLKEKPGGIWYAKRAEKRYLEGPLNTPSGKVELYSQRFADHGYSPLPTYLDPVATLENGEQVIRDYPLVGATGARVLAYLHSQYRQIDNLRHLTPEPVVEIGIATAGVYGVSNGELVRVESPQGAVVMKAQVSGDVMEGFVQVSYGWEGEANGNILTSDTHRDPISGYPSLRWFPCRVRKLSEPGPAIRTGG